MPTATVAQVSATDELIRRVGSASDPRAETHALQDLARRMADDPAELLSELVKQAMAICDAQSAGISVLDGDLFLWRDLVGTLAPFAGATTPRNHSPCGICLDQRGTVLMKNPERAYGWIAEHKLVIPEVLLVPLMGHGRTPIGTLWVVARDDGSQFDSGHARILAELANFTGVALHRVQADAKLQKALEDQETLTREMGHRIANLFTMVNALLDQTARASTTKEELANALSGRLRALAEAHALVRQTYTGGRGTGAGDLGELVDILMRPWRLPSVEGEAVRLGEHATNAVALVLYELATNAGKYGAFATPHGAVAIAWKSDGSNLVLTWRETGGPAIARPPTRKGFGSTLIAGTVAGMGGTLEHDWSPAGLALRLTLPLAGLAR